MLKGTQARELAAQLHHVEMRVSQGRRARFGARKSGPLPGAWEVWAGEGARRPEGSETRGWLISSSRTDPRFVTRSGHFASIRPEPMAGTAPCGSGDLSSASWLGPRDVAARRPPGWPSPQGRSGLSRIRPPLGGDAFSSRQPDPPHAKTLSFMSASIMFNAAERGNHGMREIVRAKWIWSEQPVFRKTCLR